MKNLAVSEAVGRTVGSFSIIGITTGALCTHIPRVTRYTGTHCTLDES